MATATDPSDPPFGATWNPFTPGQALVCPTRRNPCPFIRTCSSAVPAATAFTRYQEIFGGELTLLTMSDMPSDEPVPAEHADMIMHAALKVGDDLLMASDDPSTDSFGPVQGMQVSLSVANVDEAERLFGALADGGEIRQPIAHTSWSPMFGMCVDRFGTPWMINAEAPPQGS